MDPADCLRTGTEPITLTQRTRQDIFHLPQAKRHRLFYQSAQIFLVHTFLQAVYRIDPFQLAERLHLIIGDRGPAFSLIFSAQRHHASRLKLRGPRPIEQHGLEFLILHLNSKARHRTLSAQPHHMRTAEDRGLTGHRIVDLPFRQRSFLKHFIAERIIGKQLLHRMDAYGEQLFLSLLADAQRLEFHDLLTAADGSRRSIPSTAHKGSRRSPRPAAERRGSPHRPDRRSGS